MATPNDDAGVCAACGKTDNDVGLFIWILSGDVLEPYCPGPCIDGLLEALRDAGLHQAAQELQESIAHQIAGGWRDNVRLLEQTQPPKSRQRRRRKNR